MIVICSERRLLTPGAVVVCARAGSFGKRIMRRGRRQVEQFARSIMGRAGRPPGGRAPPELCASGRRGTIYEWPSSMCVLQREKLLDAQRLGGFNCQHEICNCKLCNYKPWSF